MLATLIAPCCRRRSWPAERRDALAKEFAVLTDRAGQERRSELLFRSAPSIGPNAFAMPGGTVLLFDQLVAIAEFDDEILGVLAHELGHAEGRHPLRLLYQVLGLNAAIMLLGGEPGDLIEAAAHQGSSPLGFAYSRDFEREADSRSVELMVKAGRDPVAFVRLLGRLEAKMGGGVPRRASSPHIPAPPTASRTSGARPARSAGAGNVKL
jgi:predicted Zn-dependent protease